MPTIKDKDTDSERKFNLILDEVSEKIMRVLLENPRIPYTKSSLAKNAEVSRNALYRRWEKFQELGIIEEAPSGGERELYRLNVDSEIANQIGEMLYLEDE